jgi:hypothetical protein
MGTSQNQKSYFVTFIAQTVLLLAAISPASASLDCYNTCSEQCERIAPNVTCYCEANHLDCSRLLANIQLAMPKGKDDWSPVIGSKNEDGCYFQSSSCKNTPQTYFRSSSPMIYQLRQLSAGRYIALYNINKTEDILTKRINHWSVAILDGSGKILKQGMITIKWKYDNDDTGVWDMIDTGLKVINEHEAVIEIYYEHTGSGSWTQGHESRISYDGKSLKIRTRQVVDDAKGKM